MSDNDASRAAANVSPAERSFVLLFGAFVMLITTIPYFIGYSTQGDLYRFSGFVFGVEDGNSYIAKMLSGWAGNGLFRSPYTASPQNGLLIYLPFIFLGKLAAPPGLHEQLVALYHLFRIGAGMLAVWASYDFIAYFVRSIHLRRLGLILVSLGGGLGWLFILLEQSGWMQSPSWMADQWLNRMPLDLISPEAFGFLALFGLPHLAMARALLLWALLAYLKLIEPMKKSEFDIIEFKPLSAARLSLLWLLAGFFLPLSLIVIGVVIVVHLGGLILCRIWTRNSTNNGLPHPLQPGSDENGGGRRYSNPYLRLVALLIAAGLLPGVFLAYNFLVSLFDSYAKFWMEQNQIPSPHIFHYLLAYGVMIPYALIGGRRLLKENSWDGWLLVGWVLVFPLLVYAPLGLQRRLTEGVWVAWCVLAMASLDRSAASPSQNRRKLVPFVLVFPTTLILLLGGLLAVLRPSVPLFLPREQARAFEILQARVEPGAVVLSVYETANPLPAWAPVRVLVGHGPESIHSSELAPQVEAFFQLDTDNQQRLELIHRFNIRYIFWGPAERKLGSWSPFDAGYLKALSPQEGDGSGGEYQIFMVKEAEP